MAPGMAVGPQLRFGHTSRRLRLDVRGVSQSDGEASPQRTRHPKKDRTGPGGLHGNGFDVA
ncbi:MAG TPA: hypothetical protein VN748_22330 [Pseudonocardiaceae bacterium]|nr:hypothetical protein [Pseudonocardiaceae bacterium]